jgi:TonB family protein
MRLPIYFFVVLVFVFSSFSLAGGQETAPPSDLNRPYRITYQPKATYTDKARAKSVEGAVRLRITLLSTGQVGDISLVETKGWRKMKKYGLMQQAINAARQIEFTPKIVNGQPMSVVVTREYTFTVY